MKRETSALERAQRRRQTARVLIKSGRTVAAPIFGTLALVTMLIAGYQLFSQWRFESGVAANEAAANRVAVAIKNILDGQAQSVQSYAEDPGLAAVLRSSEAAISDAERKLAENAGLERALLLEPRVELITPEAYPGTNYSAIAVALLAKKDLSVAGPIVGGQGENTRLNWAAPILDGDTLVGELVATFSARPLSEALARAPGYLDIRILRKSGGSEVVDYRGSLSGGLVDSLPHVQATRNIGVGYGYDRPFGLLMDSRVGAIALLLFGLGLGVLAYWIKFQPDWSFLKRSSADDDEDEQPEDDELVDSELREA
ncbi:MAG: hypothetical protein R3200_15665, partial [Xanthomonadales bacterium]|nr:hypothetical protein [Xanthomonadales bacterium]